MSQDAVAKVREFLDRMKLKYTFDEATKTFSLYFNIRISENKYARAVIYVKIGREWVLIVSPLINQKKIPVSVDRLKLYERLLLDTYYLNEVTYGLTREGDIVVHAEIHHSALTYENFKTEFNSVVYGIGHFAGKILEDFEKYKQAANISYIM